MQYEVFLKLFWLNPDKKVLKKQFLHLLSLDNQNSIQERPIEN